MHPQCLIFETQSELDGGCRGRAGADPPVFILVGRKESRSKVLAVITLTYELSCWTSPRLRGGGPQQHVGCTVQRSESRAAAEHEHRCQDRASAHFLCLVLRFE